MKYISENDDIKLHNSAITLGKFDGIHKGHQILLNKIIELKKAGYTSVMFSFLYHPSNLFNEKELELIYTEDEKIYTLSKTGLDVLISYPFTRQTANIEPEDFIKRILVDRFDAKIIVVGKDFHFGHNRKGNVELLKRYSSIYGYEVIDVEKLKIHDTIVGSSLIRSELKKGNIETVNELLGRPYSIIGEVLHGRKIGRTIGIPTTNLIPSSNKLLPPNGVYASKTTIDGVEYMGVTNIGYKPSVGAESRKGIETYLFDFNANLYGKTIEVALYHFERIEQKYASIDELKGQIEKDIENTKQYFYDNANK